MSAKGEAVERLAKAAKGLADDWGWRGGKPGEITGGEYEKLRDAAMDRAAKASGGVNNYAFDEILDEEMIPVDDMVRKQLLESNNSFFRNLHERDFSEPFEVMAEFQELETANIPRQWTGKVMQAILQAPFLSASDHGRVISDIMAPLTNKERTRFLQELPNTGRDPRNAAIKLGLGPAKNLNDAERSMLIDLMNRDKVSTFDQLITRAKALTRANYRSNR